MSQQDAHFAYPFKSFPAAAPCYVEQRRPPALSSAKDGRLNQEKRFSMPASEPNVVEPCALTISIVTYKTPVEELMLAINSCLTAAVSMKIILVDNSPSDSLAAVCREMGVTYVKTSSNLGFGAAHNIAQRMGATSRYHLVMNADVCFGAGLLEELTEFLDLNPSVGLVMPNVLNPDGSSQRLCKRLPSPLDILMRRALPSAMRRFFLGAPSFLELSDMDMQKVLSAPYLSGCFMLLRNSTLLTTGLFDENFFMYFEDLDLSRRIHQHCNTVYYPGVSLTHRHGRGSFKSLWLLLCGIHSAGKYFQKWGWFNDPERSAFNRAVVHMEHLRLPIAAISRQLNDPAVH